MVHNISASKSCKY